MKFEQVMSEKTNDELLKIVTELRNDYQVKAVETAERELYNRGVDIEQAKMTFKPKAKQINVRNIAMHSNIDFGNI